MSAAGRADLLRAWEARGEAGLGAVARLLDFEERKRGETEAAAGPAVEPPPVPAPAPDSKLAPIPFWHLAEIEHLEPEPAPAAPPAGVRPIDLAGLGRLPGSPPPAPPLSPDVRLLGNVWEWCEDWYGSYQEGTAIDPIGPLEGGRRVCRGGSWRSLARRVRAASRLAGPPARRWHGQGFRLARGQSALETAGAERREGPRDAAGDQRSKARDAPA